MSRMSPFPTLWRTPGLHALQRRRDRGAGSGGAAAASSATLAERMTGSEASRLQALRERVETLGSKRVLTDQLAYVQDKRMELLHLQQRLGDLANAEIARKQKTFTALAASLDAMSPLKVLGRGYAVAGTRGGAGAEKQRGSPYRRADTCDIGQRRPDRRGGSYRGGAKWRLKN